MDDDYSFRQIQKQTSSNFQELAPHFVLRLQHDNKRSTYTYFGWSLNPENNELA